MINELRKLWIWLKLCLIGAIKTMQEQIWDRQPPLNKDDLIRGEENDVIVITGGGRGIGWEAVKLFIEMDYSIILGVREPERVSAMLKSFLSSIPRAADDDDTRTAAVNYDGPDSTSYTCLHLDLSEEQSVRRFASQVIEKCQRQRRHLRVLVNNAGIMFGPRVISGDGIEMQLAVNYMSHFLLTHLLMPLMVKEQKSGREDVGQRIGRVVNVTSAAHAVGLDALDLDDLQCRKFYSPEGSYGISKLCQILSSNFLQSKLKSDSQRLVQFISVHPGVVNTDLYRNANWVRVLMSSMMKSVQQGAQTIVNAALDKHLEASGKEAYYLENFHLAKASNITNCIETQTKLYNISCRHLHIEEFGCP